MPPLSNRRNSGSREVCPKRPRLVRRSLRDRKQTGAWYAAPPPTPKLCSSPVYDGSASPKRHSFPPACGLVFRPIDEKFSSPVSPSVHGHVSSMSTHSPELDRRANACTPHMHLFQHLDSSGPITDGNPDDLEINTDFDQKQLTLDSPAEHDTLLKFSANEGEQSVLTRTAPHHGSSSDPKQLTFRRSIEARSPHSLFSPTLQEHSEPDNFFRDRQGGSRTIWSPRQSGVLKTQVTLPNADYETAVYECPIRTPAPTCCPPLLSTKPAKGGSDSQNLDEPSVEKKNVPTESESGCHGIVHSQEQKTFQSSSPRTPLQLIDNNVHKRTSIPHAPGLAFQAPHKPPGMSLPAPSDKYCVVPQIDTIKNELNSRTDIIDTPICTRKKRPRLIDIANSTKNICEDDNDEDSLKNIHSDESGNEAISEAIEGVSANHGRFSLTRGCDVQRLLRQSLCFHNLLSFVITLHLHRDILVAEVRLSSRGSTGARCVVADRTEIFIVSTMFAGILECTIHTTRLRLRGGDHLAISAGQTYRLDNKSIAVCPMLYIEASHK